MTQSNFEYLGCVETSFDYYKVYRKGFCYYTPIEFEGRTYFMLLFRGGYFLDSNNLWTLKPENEVDATQKTWHSLRVGIKAARKTLHSLHEHGINPDTHLHFLEENYPSLHGYALTWQQMLNDVSH